MRKSKPVENANLLMKGRLKSVDIKKDMITPMKFQQVIQIHLRAVDMMKNYCSPTTKQQDHVFPLKN